MAGSKTAVSCFIGSLLLYFAPQRRAVRQSRENSSHTLRPAESLHWRVKNSVGGEGGRAGRPVPSSKRVHRTGVPAMPLSRIEHYLIAADDMERTRDWYRDVLGMEEGWHPDFGFPVCWMYLEGKDVVHIGASAKHAEID